MPPSSETAPPAKARNPRAFFLGGLLLLAVFYTMYFARAVILPIVLAVLLNFLFSPVVEWLKRRLRLPYALSAALIVFVGLGALSLTLYNLAAPAAAWVAKGPEGLRRLEARLRPLRRPVEQVSRTAEQVEKMTGVGDSRTPTVQLKGSSLTGGVLGSTPALAAGIVIVFTLLFFLLAGGNQFTERLVKVLPRVRDKKLALAITRETERSVSTYLATTTAVNTVLGVVTGFSMYLIGLPNPILWGLVGGLLNFIPYLGGLVTVVVLTIAGLVTFDTVGRALVPGLTYLVLTNVESFVTPHILGRRLRLNSVVVFVSVLFWGWFWGILGALVAVPILATFKIFCDHIESLSSVGEFLGQ